LVLWQGARRENILHRSLNDEQRGRTAKNRPTCGLSWVLGLYNTIGDGAMLVTFVQCVICAFDEQLSPLYQAGGQKCRDHADDYLLAERGMHNEKRSTRDASRPKVNSPKSPLAGFHNPQP
jgi:hypothetical protein